MLCLATTPEDDLLALTRLCAELDRCKLANGPPEDAAAVVRAFMAAHTANAGLMTFACREAAKLAVDGVEQCEALGAAGAVQAVVAALHVRDTQLQFSACEAEGIEQGSAVGTKSGEFFGVDLGHELRHGLYS